VITCPYCGLPNWEKTGQVLNDTRRFLIVNMCRCKNENCGKMFYLVRTRIGTFTVKLDDVDPQELEQFAVKQSQSSTRHSHGRKRKSKARFNHDSSHEKHDSLRREEEKKS